MNLERYILENISRFRVKNLNLQSQVNLHKILQEASGPGDVPTLIAAVKEKWDAVGSRFQIWEPMMQWFAKNPTNSYTLKSLQVLAGEVGRNTAANIAMYKTNQTEYVNKIGELLKIIPTNDAKKNILQSFYNLINSFLKADVVIPFMDPFKGYTNMPTTIEAYNKLSDKEIASESNQIKKYYDQAGTGTFELTDDELSRLLNKLSAAVNGKMTAQAEKSWFRDKSFEQIVSEAIKISIAKGKDQIQSTAFDKKTAEPTKTYAMLDLQYPPVDAPERNKLATNFMKDDKFVASTDAAQTVSKNITEMAAQIKQMKANPSYKNLRISYVQVGAYAQTSCVNTTFGDKFGRSQKKNNIPLAVKRGEEIMDFGATQIVDILKIPKDKIIKITPITKPNVGPDWETVGGVFAEGTPCTIINYGRYFQTAYKKDPTLTPQKFYNERRNKKNEAWGSIEDEYQRVFGPMRMSVLMIKIGLEYDEVIDFGKETDFVAIYTNSFTASIAWKTKKKGGGKSNYGWWRIFKSPPSKVFVPRWTGPTNCPIF
jgi:hypothetical protein